MPGSRPRLAAVELGGTTIRAAVAEGACTNIVERETFAVAAPTPTLAAVYAWLAAQPQFDALGVASFGPIEPRKSQAKYGYITTTPKAGWQDVDVLSLLRADSFNVPVAFDTDVNAPALSEYRFLKAQSAPNLTSTAYITVGTGVGVGLVINGLPVHGMLHPEAGHCPVPRAPGDRWEPSTGHLIPSGIEANASAPALALRANVDQRDLRKVSDDSPLWDDCAHYLAALCVNLTLITSVERIVIGGGVMARECLYDKIRSRFLEMLNGYLRIDQLTPEHVDEYIVPPSYGSQAGLVGALTLALDAYENARCRRSPLQRMLGLYAKWGVVAATGFVLGVVVSRRLSLQLNLA